MRIAVQYLHQQVQKQNQSVKKSIYYESFVDFEPLIETAVANTETLTIEPKQALNQEMEDLF